MVGMQSEKTRRQLDFLGEALLALLVGVACGAAGTLFHYSVDIAQEAREKAPWLLYFLPLAGVAIVYLYRAAKLPSAIGTDRVMEAARRGGDMPVRMAPLIFLSTVLTHLFGGSAGREGAALQLGGGIGQGLERLLRVKNTRSTLMTMCGMAALFSALFGTPMTAAFFVLEVMDVGIVRYALLLPAALSSLSAQAVASALGVAPTRFVLVSGLVEPLSLGALSGMALVAAAGAALAVLFCEGMHLSAKLSSKITDERLRAAVGGAAVVAMTLLLGTRDYNGAGMDVIRRAVENGEAAPFAFAIKLLFTAVSLSCGFKGGEIVPSFFVGATLGAAMGGLLGLPAGLCAAVGLISVFCGVTNTPAASLLLSAEMFGAEYLPLFGVAIAVSMALSGHVSLYHSQRFSPYAR